MKIVYCHNYYRDRGGEDISFENDLSMLRSEGHEVIPFTRHNDQIDGNGLAMATRSIWNRQTRADLDRVLQTERPDILQCNNLFPQISMSIYGSAARLSIPVVEALRNYRAFCSNSFFYRDGQVCTDCHHLPGAWRGVVRRCYRGSATASAAVATLQLTQKLTGIRRRGVDAFVTPSEFSRQKHIEGGFDPAQIFVRPNFIFPDLGTVDQTADSADRDGTNANPYALFVGRLSIEKGIETLIKAWREFSIPMRLIIAGTGSMEPQIRQWTRGDDRFELVGQQSSTQVLQYIGGARMLIMPSQWYETFGRTIAESFSRGTPVVVSRLGAMAELVTDQTGRHFTAGYPEALAAAVGELLSLDHAAQLQMRQQCRRRYEQHYSRVQSYRRLLEVYQTVFDRRGGGDVETAHRVDLPEDVRRGRHVSQCKREIDQRLGALTVAE